MHSLNFICSRCSLNRMWQLALLWISLLLLTWSIVCWADTTLAADSDRALNIKTQSNLYTSSTYIYRIRNSINMNKHTPTLFARWDGASSMTDSACFFIHSAAKSLPHIPTSALRRCLCRHGNEPKLEIQINFRHNVYQYTQLQGRYACGSLCVCTNVDMLLQKVCSL